jgi:hypothetical protein
MTSSGKNRQLQIQIDTICSLNGQMWAARRCYVIRSSRKREPRPHAGETSDTGTAHGAKVFDSVMMMMIMMIAMTESTPGHETRGRTDTSSVLGLDFVQFVGVTR